MNEKYVIDKALEVTSSRYILNSILSVVVTTVLLIATVSVISTHRELQTKDAAYRACLETLKLVVESYKSDRYLALPTCSWGR